MSKSTSQRERKEVSFDKNIDQFRRQLDTLRGFIVGGQKNASIEEFDLTVEDLISQVFGSSSQFVDAYDYAQLGEAGGLVNITEEGPEGASLDTGRESLRQRQRVLESCVADLEARRAEANKGAPAKPTKGPRVSEFMSPRAQSISMDATLKEAACLLQNMKIGSLLVEGGDEFIGSISETELSHEVVARGVDPLTTTVKTCMREPLITIESSEAIVEVVKLMKEKAIRHAAVTESGKIIGVISVSDILRYYSGVV